MEFPLGNRALNLELAIAAYEAALAVYTREAFPEKWAMTQNNLGNAYQNRIRGGERADNEAGAGRRSHRPPCLRIAFALAVYTRRTRRSQPTGP
jgi:hypothetical protein